MRLKVRVASVLPFYAYVCFAVLVILILFTISIPSSLFFSLNWINKCNNTASDTELENQLLAFGVTSRQTDISVIAAQDYCLLVSDDDD